MCGVPEGQSSDFEYIRNGKMDVSQRGWNVNSAGHMVTLMLNVMTQLTLWGLALQQAFDYRHEMDHACAENYSLIHSIFDIRVMLNQANGDLGIAEGMRVAGHQKRRH